MGIAAMDADNEIQDPTARPPQWPRTAVKIGLFVALLAVLNHFASHLMEALFAFQMRPHHLDVAIFLLFTSAGLYVVLMAVPFMPGIEIGFALMWMVGRPGILMVYFGTLLALSLSYLAGRKVPPHKFAGVLRWFHLHRAERLVRFLAPLSPQGRLTFLVRRGPARITPFLLRHRYLLVGLLLNLPGNALLGGGGGIGAVVGMSRLFTYPRYLLLISIAITPGPVIVLLRDALR